MKKTLRNIACVSATIGLFALASCTSDEALNGEANDGNGLSKVPQTLTAQLPGAPGTRVAYEEEQGGGITVTWRPEWDEIILRDNKNDEFTYRCEGEEGSTSATFTFRRGEDDVMGEEFYAFYQTYVGIYGYTITTPGSPGEGCGQRGDNTFDHLTDYNSMMAKGKCENGVITAPLQFQSMMAMLSFKVTMPKGETPNHISLKAMTDDDFIFPTEQRFSYWTDETYGPGHTTIIQMNLLDITTNTFTANMLFVPDDMTGKTFRVIIRNAEGEELASQPLTGTNFEAGKRYIKEVTVDYQ